MPEQYVIVKYLRLSLEDGDKEESDSIVNQRNLLDYYIHQIFKDRSVEVIEITDDGYSGTNMNRPGIKRLLVLAETKQINCVMVKDFSRFARDYIEVGRYSEQKFPEWQIRFISVNDGYDSNDFRGMTGGIHMALKSIVYTMYSRDLSEKVKSARKVLEKQGKYFAPYAFYGYDKSPDDTHKLMIDPIAAEVVKKIFALRASGTGTKEIAYILNEDQIPAPSAYKKMCDSCMRDWNTVCDDCNWSAGGVNRILRDERYTGKLIAHKSECVAVGSSKTRLVEPAKRIVVEHTHEAIISKELFQSVQGMRGKRRSVQKDNSFATGLVHCGACRHIMRTSYSLAKGKSFRCKYKDFTAENHCFKESICEGDLITVLKRLTTTELEKTVDIDKAQKKADTLMQKHKKAIQMLQKDADSEKKRKLTEYIRLTKNEISEEKFIRNRAEIDKRIERLNQKIQAILYQSISEADISVLNLFGQFVAADSMDSDRIRDLVKAIYVYNDRRIEVVWNFRDTFSL